MQEMSWGTLAADAAEIAAFGKARIDGKVSYLATVRRLPLLLAMIAVLFLPNRLHQKSKILKITMRLVFIVACRTALVAVVNFNWSAG